jgi:hypothetical protein
MKLERLVFRGSLQEQYLNRIKNAYKNIKKSVLLETNPSQNLKP